MAKVIRYNLSFLGIIKLADGDENLTDSEIRGLIADDFWDMSCGGNVECANDIDFDVEEV